ncbi:hypothetical protein ACQ4PT_069873 [Festuca glaucescens]
MCFHVSSCNSILIPYRTTGRFILFVFNLGERTITILDPIPVPDKWKTRLLNKDALKLKDISFHLNIALQAAIQGWNDDIFLWRRITPVGLPKNHDSNMSGFWVLKFMRSWNGKEVYRANAMMDSPTQSSECTPFKDLSNTISTSVVGTSNGGEPIDARERSRQRARERYAQMDKEKKDELLRKRREAYQQKKYGSLVSTRESRDSPSTLSQLQSMPDVIANINNSYNDGPIETLSIDPKEWRRQRDRERYANMDSTKKKELLKKRRESRQKQKLSTRNKENEVPAEDGEWLRRNDNYQRKTIHHYHVILSEQIEKKRARDRLHYADMTPTKKRSKKALRELRRNSLSKESIAMENPCWTPGVIHTPAPQASIPPSDWYIPEFGGTPIYIQPASEQMLVEATPNMDDSNISRRKHVTPGEMHALLGLRNEAFYANSKKHATTSTGENPSMTMEGVNGSETPTQSAIVNNGEDEGVILEEDSEDEEGYVFAGQEEDVDEDVEMEEEDDDSASISSVPDPYDMVYSTIPNSTHMLKPVEDCKICGAKKFKHESMGFCCRKGKIKLANPETSPDLMRIWTSEEPDARHFRDNIRFFNGHFSFTSLYCHLDNDTTNTSKHPIYTFRAHGKMYHNLRSFGRQDGLEGSHLELYFFDDDPSLEHMYRSCRKEQCVKDKEVITHLVNILRDNPYSEHLRSMGQVEDLDDYCITLNLDQRMDQRGYNAPTTSEVAAVWVEGSELY